MYLGKKEEVTYYNHKEYDIVYNYEDELQKID